MDHDETPPIPTDDSVPVFMMLPLDTINSKGDFQYSNSGWFHESLEMLVSTGVRGVAVDVWWGVVERNPRQYFWDSYRSLFRLVESTGLRLQVVLSFHSCGGNVGDNVEIPLPHWVLKTAEKDPDIFLSDRPRLHHGGRRNKEYISLFADDVPGLLQGRSPLECYADFMRSFQEEFENQLGSFITNIVVGAGPCGELRYPAYPERHGWRFPGIGEFQCYDRHALASLAQAAAEIGHPEWGHGGPHNSGTYNNSPESTGFFTSNSGSWSTQYGQFFLNWYSEALIKHGQNLMKIASSVFTKKQKTKTAISKSSIVNGMKLWLMKTGNCLWRSSSTSSQTDLQLSATESLQSESLDSLLRGSSTDSVDNNLSKELMYSSNGLEVDYGLLDVGTGILAPVITNRTQSWTVNNTNGALNNDRNPAGEKRSSILNKRWDAGDFIRRIGSFLRYEQPEILPSSSIQLSLKIAGVHWWYKTPSHAAELTAGYFNTIEHDGYHKIVDLCREFNFNLILTCVEMSDEQHPDEVCSSPEGLLTQIKNLTASAGVRLSGENALPVFFPGGVDGSALDRIIDHCCQKRVRFENPHSFGNTLNRKLLTIPSMHSFTLLRLVPEVLVPLHQGFWMRFMYGMHEPLSYSESQNNSKSR